MKRAGNLFDQVIAWDNLRLAVARALRGKRHRPDAREFVSQLDANLANLRGQMLAGTVPLGEYRQFLIHDPKERVITAPCFRERVLHHAIMNVCEPLIDRWLIDDTFACRRGKGRIAALVRTRQFARRFPFFLKLDIRKYFDSVSHDELRSRLSCLFKDKRLLDLMSRIIRSFRGDQSCALPTTPARIGTSVCRRPPQSAGVAAAGHGIGSLHSRWRCIELAFPARGGTTNSGGRS